MTHEQDGPFTEADEHPVSEFDNEPKDDVTMTGAPLSPATRYAEPPLWEPAETVSVRVARDGFATVGGKRVFVARSLAGATVNVPKAWGQ